jgi:actin-related protein
VTARVLLTSPNGSDIYITMNMLVNRRFQSLLYRVLKEQYKPAFVQFVPSMFMPIYITGMFNGLVVDFGFVHTEVIAVGFGSSDCRGHTPQADL